MKERAAESLIKLGGLSQYLVLTPPGLVENTKADGKKTTFWGFWLRRAGAPVLLEINVYSETFLVSRTFNRFDSKPIKVLKHESLAATLAYINTVLV